MSEFSRDMEERFRNNQLKRIASSLKSIAFWWWVFVVFYIGASVGTALAKFFPLKP